MDNNKILTAEEFCKEFKPTFKTWQENFHETMIEFAKLHVVKALKQASEKVQLDGYNYNEKGIQINKSNFGQEINAGTSNFYVSTSKDSILNAYSLENIK